MSCVAVRFTALTTAPAAALLFRSPLSHRAFLALLSAPPRPKADLKATRGGLGKTSCASFPSFSPRPPHLNAPPPPAPVPPRRRIPLWPLPPCRLQLPAASGNACPPRPALVVREAPAEFRAAAARDTRGRVERGGAGTAEGWGTRGAGRIPPGQRRAGPAAGQEGEAVAPAPPKEVAAGPFPPPPGAGGGGEGGGGGGRQRPARQWGRGAGGSPGAGRCQPGGATAAACPGTPELELRRRGGGRPCRLSRCVCETAAAGGGGGGRGASRPGPAHPPLRPLVVRETQTHTARAHPFSLPPLPSPRSPRRPERARCCHRVSGLPRPGPAAAAGGEGGGGRGGRPSYERRGGGLLGLAPKVPTGEEVEALRECPLPLAALPLPPSGPASAARFLPPGQDGAPFGRQRPAAAFPTPLSFSSFFLYYYYFSLGCFCFASMAFPRESGARGGRSFFPFFPLDPSSV